MSIIIEGGDSDIDADLASVHEFEELQSETSSNSSYMHIDLDDDTDDEDIDTTGSIDLDDQQQNHELEEVDAEILEQSLPEEDLCSSIPGMYRILDLISERGTSGLVDKIIIAQESLRRFLNEISPGSYVSLTKVDFKALDKFQVKPIGIYGSKDEIVRFLVSIEVIDDSVATKLIGSSETSVENLVLRSGLYICRVPKSAGGVERMYVIHWPEESTWDDDASPPVRRNRVTFLRYLTKICDQVIALISEDHAKSIVWNNSVDDDRHSQSDEDDTDRLFTFEVAKTTEQEEGVSVRKGFECTSDELLVPEVHSECEEDPDLFKPRLLFGETRQGFMTTQYVPIKRSVKSLDFFKISAFILHDSLMKERLQISESINPKSLNHLIRLGLGKRFPDEHNIWTKEVTIP
ncbi:hypothetical protein JVU11DRAFT_11581 [Chiua virens]|nr:hypothetical protein JVU11DRAFT_11581 [Chiua virens]